MHDLEGHTGQVTDVAVSPRADVVLTTSTDGTGRLWDVATGKLVSILIGHTNYVVSGAFSPGGFFVVTASTDGTARVWRTESGNTITVFVGHEGSLGDAAYSPGARQVLTFGADGTARIWDPDAEPLLGLIGRLRVPDRRAEAATLSPAASLIAATGGGAMTVFETSGRFLHAQRGVVEAAFSPDSQRVAGTDLRGNVLVWDARRGTRIGMYAVESEQVAFAPDGDRVAGIGQGVLRAWDAQSPRLPRVSTFSVAAGRPSAFAWGRWLVVGTDDGSVHVLDERGRELATARGHKDDITAISFSRDGHRFVTASADHDARIWDAETGRLLHVLRAHFAVVSDARFSDDGRWIVTAGPGKAAIWDAQTGRRLLFLRGHDGILRSAAFRPETHAVVTVGEDRTIRTYDCKICGSVEELIPLAEQRLAGISPR
jgi:WD40 repeat protein